VRFGQNRHALNTLSATENVRGRMLLAEALHCAVTKVHNAAAGGAGREVNTRRVALSAQGHTVHMTRQHRRKRPASVPAEAVRACVRV
jgi:hypothetical protein